MMDSTIVVPRGWQDLADAASYYPDDLPAEWRLTYFANQYPAVLLPHSLWSRAGAADWAQWRTDVPRGFRFIAEIGASRTVGQAQTDLQRALGPALGAWLLADQCLDSQFEHDAAAAPYPLPCWHATAARPADLLSQETDAYAVVAPAAVHRDLRGAREWLEDLCRRNTRPPAVVILSLPDSVTLTAWQQLVELLGLRVT